MAYLWHMALVSLITNCIGKEQLLLGLLGIGINTKGPSFKLPYLGSAMTIAVDNINNNPYILPNHTLRFVVGYDQCSSKIGLDAFVTLVQEHQIQGVIGPACSRAAIVVGLLASQWNMPVVSYSTSDIALSDKKVYDTFIRSRPPTSQMGSAIQGIARQFDWKTIGILQMQGSGHFVYIENGVIHYLGEDNVTIAGPEYYEAVLSLERFIKPLQKLAQQCRSKYCFMSN